MSAAEWGNFLALYSEDQNRRRIGAAFCVISLESQSLPWQPQVIRKFPWSSSWLSWFYFNHASLVGEVSLMKQQGNRFIFVINARYRRIRQKRLFSILMPPPVACGMWTHSHNWPSASSNIMTQILCLPVLWLWLSHFVLYMLWTICSETKRSGNYNFLYLGPILACSSSSFLAWKILISSF